MSAHKRSADVSAHRALEGRLEYLIEQSPLAMHVFAPDGTSLLANRAWDELWNLEDGESSEGKNVFEDEQVRAAGLLPHVEEAAAGETVSTPHLLYEPARAGRDGDPRWLKAFCYPVKDAGGKVREVGLIIEDVTERKRLEESLVHRAFHDDLTGLPNRDLLLVRLEHALVRAWRRGASGSGGAVAVLLLDLDNFKHVNDSRGYDAGDRLLVAVADRLKDYLSPECTIARLGGDEFGVLLEEPGARERARDAAEAIAKGLGPPFPLDGGEVFITASVGVAMGGTAGEDPQDPQDLLRGADVAMYRAKEGGKNRSVVFETSMDGRYERRLSLEAGLRRALERGELTVLYQPVVDLVSGRCAGVEALVRWIHPDRGMISPATFVPLAEETGLILEVGEGVLREACARAREWRALWPEQRDGVAPPAVWVNLSARQLREPGLSGLVAGALDEAGIGPGSLGLEITESVAMDEAGVGFGRTTAVLRDLRDLGVRVAIDDFGTGYSSLSYLKRLPVDVLKMDRSFVSGLGADEKDRAIVSAAVSLALDLGLEVVAEGVETEGQLRILQGLGCRFAQGYHFAKPLPAHEISGRLSHAQFPPRGA